MTKGCAGITDMRLNCCSRMRILTAGPAYLNMRNTLHALFECEAVPIINENDTISVDEIKLGDNDQLAAMVTNLLQAPLLIILSVVDGLYRSRPGGSGQGEIIPVVAQIDDEVLALAGSSRSALGTGGMQSKLAAARRVTHAGGSVIIASGTQRRAADADSGRRTGGHVVPGTRGATQSSKTLDRTDGPTTRLLHCRRGSAARPGIEHKSLLAIGILEVVGEFEKGDVVGIRDRRVANSPAG